MLRRSKVLVLCVWLSQDDIKVKVAHADGRLITGQQLAYRPGFAIIGQTIVHRLFRISSRYGSVHCCALPVLTVHLDRLVSAFGLFSCHAEGIFTKSPEALGDSCNLGSAFP